MKLVRFNEFHAPIAKIHQPIRNNVTWQLILFFFMQKRNDEERRKHPWKLKNQLNKQQNQYKNQ